MLFFLVNLINMKEQKIIKLPKPENISKISIEEALLKRRSIREYKDEALTIKEVSQILWSAQGITEPKKKFRTAPSAGAIFPLNIYLVVNKVENIEKGIYKYLPETHEIIQFLNEDKREDIYKACLQQSCIKNGAIIIVITGNFEKIKKRYSERGVRYTYIEVGHCSQNIYLQCVSLNLGTVAVGAFYDEEVKKILKLPDEEEPLYLMPIGKIKD
ncbi:MAG TPA: SagB/ThcOx family dehydrogenase [bacterium]|nr:SagB/ThcOx family dehydrogenase [bacterium]